MSYEKEHPLQNAKNFNLMCSLQLEDTIPLYMYKSKNTGITVCIAELDGPLVSGYFNIVTETFDDDGLSHTLSHLIFMGSEEYPYNNFLKLWADKCLIRDMKARNVSDRTYFGLSAAGSEAFLSLMPIYLDHILYPSLKDSAYLTEVHHINQTGENDGNLYCKVRDEECKSSNIMYKQMITALFPHNCGYTSIVHGTTTNLRESSNNEKVKQFHEKFYKPDNLTVLIAGKIHRDQLSQALLHLEQKIMSKGKKDAFINPWQTPIKPLEKSTDVEVTFPSTGKNYGLVYVAWRGPSGVTQMYDYRGCLSLLAYLTETSSSPLKTEFIETNNISITYRSYVYSISVLNIIFSNVPIHKIDLIKSSLQQILCELCNPGNSINIKMRTAINNLICQQKRALEKNQHDTIASLVFDHIVYGNSVNDLDQRLNSIRDFEKLKKEPETYFVDLLKKYFVDAPMVVVRGKPTNVNLMVQEEKNYIDKQIAQVGQEGLKKKEKEFLEAMKKMKKSVSYEVLTSVPIPGTNSITLYHFERYNTETSEQHPELDSKTLPFFTYLDHVNTNFIYLQVIMDSSSISQEDRLYIPLLMEIITESPVKRGDQLIPYEEIKKSLQGDTIKCKSYIGINTAENYSQSVSLMLQVELHNYEKGVQWCKELLYDSKLTVDRVKIITARLRNKHIKVKDQGEDLVVTIQKHLFYIDDSNLFACSMLHQVTFLTEVMERLETDVGQEEVIAKIESVRKILTSPKNMFLHMAVNVDKLAEQVRDVYAPWNKFFSDFINLEKTKPTVTADWEILKRFDQLPQDGYIWSLESIKSSFFTQVCLCINDFQNPDLPALIVSLKYFTQKGGPMSKVLISKAISNSFYFYLKVNEGLLYLRFLPATNIVSAYTETKSIVEAHIVKPLWDQYGYEKAKSSAILDYINEVKSIRSAIKVSLKYYCKNLPHDYNKQMIQRISAVTMDDMSRVTDMYVKQLFDAKKSKTAIVCNKSKVAEIQEAFEKLNYVFYVSGT